MKAAGQWGNPANVLRVERAHVRVRNVAGSQMSSPVEVRRVPLRFFDAPVTPLTSTEVVTEIRSAIAEKRALRIANLNLHGLYVYETDGDFASYTRSAGLCLIDGWPVLRIVKPRDCRNSAYRVGSTDWLDELLPLADGLRIVAIGGAPDASLGAAQAIVSRYPAVTWTPIAGYGVDTAEMRVTISQAVESADIVLVGMGMPRQERWIEANHNILDGKVVANVGGCFDYYAGVQALAPRWMGRWGLEWAYRLCKSPRRLAYRYLVEPIRLLMIVIVKGIERK